jgi:hypothetical protein
MKGDIIQIINHYKGNGGFLHIPRKGIFQKLSR